MRWISKLSLRFFPEIQTKGRTMTGSEVTQTRASVELRQRHPLVAVVDHRLVLGSERRVVAKCLRRIYSTCSLEVAAWAAVALAVVLVDQVSRRFHSDQVASAPPMASNSAERVVANDRASLRPSGCSSFLFFAFSVLWSYLNCPISFTRPRLQTRLIASILQCGIPCTDKLRTSRPTTSE